MDEGDRGHPDMIRQLMNESTLIHELDRDRGGKEQGVE